MWDAYRINAVKQMHYAGLAREEKQQELQVDQPWHGICPGEAVVGGTGLGHILLEQV